MNINKKETYNLDKVYKYVFDKRWRGKPSEMSVETYYKDIKEFFDNKDIKYIDYQLMLVKNNANLLILQLQI